MAQLPDTASPPEATIFSVRIVSLDYYMAPPIPDLDICYSSFHGRSVKEVPVIRIYGSTPAGQKTCLHIHRVLPFLYIHFPAELLQSSNEGLSYIIHTLTRNILFQWLLSLLLGCVGGEISLVFLEPFLAQLAGDEYIKALMTTMEKTLVNQNVSSAKKQCVHGYNLVRAKKIYGYHLLEDVFLKIYLYYPHDVARAATMLLDGAVFGRTFQPYESHIPYLLHFLVDYNLYGMGHIHTSKIKFRPPLPDGFLQKVVNQNKHDFRADKGKEAVGDSAIWLSSTVPSAFVWPDSVISQLSTERMSISLTKRQSICELEGDSSVDDILNEKNKIYTSLSQSRPEVKMVQSLIPIWEEFEQCGILEVAKPLELSRPHPQHVLKNFMRGLHYENALSESFLKMYKSLPENALAFEDDEKLEEHIKLLAGMDEKLELMECKQGNNSFCEPVDDYEVNNKTDMFHGLQSEEKEETLLCEKISEFHHLASGKKNLPTPVRNEDEKTLSTEALGLLSWFASSQAADDLNAEDELVQEAILTPLYAIDSYKTILEIAHLDYEHASQQECEDILDSVEYACETDVVKEHSSHVGYHEQVIAASSGETIHQADGSLDGHFGTYTKHNSERSANSRQLNLFKDKDSFVMNRNGKFFKYRRRETLLGPLPFSTTQKDCPDPEPYSSTDESLENDENCHASYIAETSGKKLGKPLASCSVRDLMRQKRHLRAGYNEPERISVDVLHEALHNEKKSLCLESSHSCTMLMSNMGSSCVGNENSAHSAKCLLGQCTSRADECVIRQDDIQYLSKCDEQNARENCHDPGSSSRAEYANMLQKNYCGTVGSGACNVNPTMLITSKVEKTFMEFVERSFIQKAPSKDQIVHILEDSPDATGNPAEAHSEAIHSCCMNTDPRGMDDLLPFFSRDYEHRRPYQPPNDVEGCELLQESALGIPTHFLNDGSVLYLLSHATSPPSADSVCQWLLNVEGGCSNNTSGNSKRNLQTSQGRSLKLQERYEVVDEEANYCLHEIAEDKPLLTRGNTRSPPVGSHGHTVTSFPEPKLSSICSGEVVPDSSWQDISQISGPDDKSNSTPLSQIGFRDPASIGGGQQLTLMSVEAQAESRGNLLPDPKFDRINVISLVVQEDTSPMLAVYVLIRGVNDEPQRNKDGVNGCNISIFNEEKHLLNQFVKIISSVDPDILMGWEIQGGSLGFIAERAERLGICLLKSISRTPDNVSKTRIGDSDNSKLDPEISEASMANTGLQDAAVQDELRYTHADGIHVSGRIVLNIWRLMRSEVKLNMYSIEAVAEGVLRRKIPSIPCKVLNHWFSKGPGRSRSRCIEYLIERTKLNLEIINQLDMINRTSELARVFGIDFFSVLSRGSQFRVESMLLRLAHTQNYLAISPGNQQVALQPAMECLPLVMEPESNFYEDPVVVLDFQSLYPSMIIAYNLCFSTCLGKVVPSKSNVLGVSSYSADPHLFKDLSELLLLAPNGVMYVPSKVRKGVLPRLLEEILSTRILIKQAIKKLKPSQQILERILNARQLALKLIANVTYGYTAAGFSGRMPCAELADSIVQCGRRTLEEAISFVNKHPRWKARVIYGDTDSMFVLLKGRDKDASFRIGNEIASAITSMNPDPVTLKLEKVYQPCFLLTKKRYVGYSYESPDQENPIFDAKGIETVRRDTCPAVAKILEKSTRLIFEHRDISKVKSYLQRQWTRILSGRVSLQDFIFAKEVHLGTYSTRMSSLPPAAIVATKAMNADPRSEPRNGQRVPYVVVHGEPGARLVDMVVDPHDLLEINSPYRLNDLYYIKKQIIPALQRVFGLLGADLNQWFLEMPRSIRPELALSYLGSSHDCDYNGRGYTRKAQVKRSRIDTYYSSKHCVICGDLVQRSKHLCDICLEKKPLIATAIVGKTSRLERDIQHLTAICRHCGGGHSFPGSGVPCNSLACSIFYERRKVQKELQADSIFAAEIGLYPICMTEWF